MLKLQTAATAFCLATMSLTPTSVLAALPDDYQSRYAREKQDLLWQNTLDAEYVTLPPYVDKSWNFILSHIGALFRLNETFEYVSDEMPKHKAKLTHNYGVLAHMRFVPVGNSPFTGIYGFGGIGVIRLSMTADPSTGYIQAMALKFLVDGAPSVNLHLMNNLDGQGDNWNFFAGPFSNKLPHATSKPVVILEKIFEKVKNPANELPVEHLAKIDTEGTVYKIYSAPEQLFFEPDESLRYAIDPKSREDFRETLKAVVAEGELGQLYGMVGEQRVLLGSIYVESELIASQYADEVLFFQHNR
jgi:hypothetical protein